MFLFLFLFIFPINLQENREQWIEAKAIITEIDNSIKTIRKRSFAAITYLDKDGKEYESQVEILAIPIYGTLKSVNDSIDIFYDKEKPFLVKSQESSFVESYGLYLLIGAGVLISLYNFRNINTKSSNKIEEI